MKVIIAGAGEVGHQIAQLLTQEGHDITIIEKDVERIEVLKDKLDVLFVHGDATREKILERAGISKTNLFVAVTDDDPANIIACMIAKGHGAKKRIARMKQIEYSKTSKINTKNLGIDFIVRPRNIIANEICNTINYLNAHEVGEFADGKVVYIGYPIAKDSQFIGSSIGDLKKKIAHIKCTVMALTGVDDKVEMPKGGEPIDEGDVISFVIAKKDINLLREIFNFKTDPTSDVFILGGGQVGTLLARRLIDARHNVKIIENSATRCEVLSNKLDEAMVICTNGIDTDTLKEEGVDEADVYVAVTNDENANILGALLAKRFGVKRVITIVKQANLVSLSDSLGVDVTINPRLATASAIMKYVRGDKVFGVTMLNEENTEVVELQLSKKSPVVSKEYKNMDIPEGIRVGAIVRKDQVIIPDDEEVFLEGDHVIVLSFMDKVSKMEKLFK